MFPDLLSRLYIPKLNTILNYYNGKYIVVNPYPKQKRLLETYYGYKDIKDVYEDEDVQLAKSLRNYYEDEEIIIFLKIYN